MIVAAVRMSAAGGGERLDEGRPHHWFIHTFLPDLTEHLLCAGNWLLSGEHLFMGPVPTDLAIQC